jgi:peptidoglycan/LPS O-acetylase OafA/YrhL
MSRRARWWLEGLGVLGLVLVVVGIRYLAALDSFTYRGGLALVTVGAAGLTAAAAHPATLVKRLFGLAPLRWLGVRSYGVHLWHWPVLQRHRRRSGGGGVGRARAEHGVGDGADRSGPAGDPRLHHP